MKLAAAEGRGPSLGPEAPIVIEDASASDYHAVRAALILAHADHRAELPPATFSAYLAELLDLEARAGCSQLLVARRAGRVLGTVTYYPDAAKQGAGWADEGWASLSGLAVVPQARQQGVGRWLMGACLSRTRASQVPVLGLHVAEFMLPALSLCRQLGFRPAPYFDLKDRPVPAQAYLRLLP